MSLVFLQYVRKPTDSMLKLGLIGFTDIFLNVFWQSLSACVKMGI